MRHCSTCRCTPGPLCECGHQETSHDLQDRRRAGRTVRVRTSCSVHTGPKGTPCGCLLFAPRKEP